MIASVKERKESVYKFCLCYEDICKLQDRVPLPSVKGHLKKNILDFNGDKITYDEWGPILNALSLDRTLYFIAIRSTRCGKTVLEEVTTESKARSLERTPVIQTRFVLLLIMKSVRMCMSNTRALTCMELEGLPLSRDYLNEFVEGVKNCSSLQNISLHRSPIGDEGCSVLCQAIKLLPNIISIDMSNCNLTEQSACAIADVIKYQKIHRYSESWKHTLRYREPDLDSLPGLRRITLNHNVRIRDQGLHHLMDIVKDDLFLKALDMQDCGISDGGGMLALEVLKCNVSLAIVDLRANRDMNPALLKQIMQQLHINNQGCAQEYHWIAVDRFQLSHETRKTRPRTRSQSVKPVANTSCRSVKSDPISSGATVPKRSKSSTPSKGVPWRITERVDRRKEHTSVCPGTPRTVQFQEELPPYHMARSPDTSPHIVQLERVKQQLAWLSQQLSAEVEKRHALEEENLILKKQLQEFPGDGKVVMDCSTIMEMNRSLADLRILMPKLRELGVDPDALLDPHNILMRKSYSEHATRQAPRQPDVHKVSKSACAMGNSAPVQVEIGIGDTTNKEVSSEGTAGTLTYQECSSESNEVSSEDSNAQGDNTNEILYHTVLRKNRELHYHTEDDLY